MELQMNRRQFVQSSTLLLAGAAGAALAPNASSADAGPSIKKAVGWGMIVEPKLSVEDKFRVAKDAGFEGVEISRAALKKGGTEPEVLARAAEKTGVRIHGVSNGSITDIPAAIDEAVLYGGNTVLQVLRADPNVPFM